MSTQSIINNAIDALRTAAFDTNDERKQAEYQSAADDLEDALHDVQKQAEALDDIQALLDGTDWKVDMLDDIAAMLRETGREINEPDEDEDEDDE